MQNELYHYGVKGMKWGVRRYRNYDGTLTVAGRKQIKNQKKSTNEKQVYGSAASVAKKQQPTSDRDHSKSDKSPLALFLASAAFDIAMMNPIGLVEDTGRLAMAGKSFVQSKIYENERKNCNVDKKTGFLLKHNDNMSVVQDAARVNPGVYNFDNNTKKNCMLCTAAYDLRRRGYEVQAKNASYGFATDEVKAWYPKAKIEHSMFVNDKGKPSTKAMMSGLKKQLVKQGDGARGNLMITWKGMRSGHSVAYEINNGKVVIIDAQIGKVYSNPDTFLKRCEANVSYARLDNIGFSTKTIKEVAK